MLLHGYNAGLSLAFLLSDVVAIRITAARFYCNLSHPECQKNNVYLYVKFLSFPIET